MTTPRIVAIGDSIIYGRLDSQESGWTGMLRVWLESHIDDTSAVFNLGIGGNTSRDVLERVPVEVEPRSPNCVVVGIGTNDSRRQDADSPTELPVEDFADNVRKIIKAVAAPDRLILVAGLLPVDEARACPHPASGYYHYNSDVSSF